MNRYISYRILKFEIKNQQKKSKVIYLYKLLN